ALGAEFDVVINIDGYNETALAISENDVGDVFVAYPRAWAARLQDVVDPRLLSVSNRLFQIRAKRQSRAQWIVGSPARRSPTVSLIWALQDRYLRQEQIQLGLDLVEFIRSQGHGFARQGPRQM